MSSPGTGPCQPYISQLDLCCVVSGAFPDPCLVEGQPISQDKIDGAIQAASELMYVATGKQFGLCTVKIRPCKQGCGPCDLPFFGSFGGWSYGWDAYPWYPAFNNGMWTNINPCDCQGSCGCSALSEIPLPYPVSCVNEVVVDGIVLDPSEYRVDDFKTLVRLNGKTWPKCQDMTLQDTEVGTFSVTVTYGKYVPFLVAQATADLACNLLKACVGASCQLPQRISSMTRQGITVGFLDTMAFLDRGRTGIYLVDLAINTFNPRRLQKNASVFSVDKNPRWRRTDTNCTDSGGYSDFY